MWPFDSEKRRQKQEKKREEKERRQEEAERQREAKERLSLAKLFEQRWQNIKPQFTEASDLRGEGLDLDSAPANRLITTNTNPLLAASDTPRSSVNHALLADAAAEFITQSLGAHAQKLHNIRERHGHMPQDLVIKNVFFDRAIGSKMRNELRDLRERIRFIIYHIAELIELDSIRQNTQRAELARTADSYQLQKLSRAAQGEYEFHVSYRSLAVAMKVFAQVNKQLKHQAQKAARTQSRKTELDFQTQSALLVFEFLDVIIGHLKNFQIGGEQTLRTLFHEIEAEVKANAQSDVELERRMNEIADQQAITNDRRILENRKTGRRLILEKWQGLLDKLSRASDKATRFTGKIQILEVKRDNARNQIGLMALLRLANFADENIQAVEALLDFDGLELEILEPEDFASLLNMSPAEIGKIGESQDLPPDALERLHTPELTNAAHKSQPQLIEGK